MTSNPYRDARRNAGFRTQQDLADDLGVSLGAVRNWESGHRGYPKWVKRFLEVVTENKKLAFLKREIMRFLKAIQSEVKPDD